MSIWQKGAGLATELFRRVFQNKSFQNSLTEAVTAIGQKIKDNISNPDNLLKVAENMLQNPQAIAGVIVKGTEAEKLVEPAVVEAAKVVEDNAQK